MKKFLPLIFLFFFLQTTKAQYITIPDTGFASFLRDSFPTCMNGKQLDTMCSKVVRTKFLYIQHDISDLTGIQYFDSLHTLWCGTDFLTSLPVLPKSLRVLDCSFNRIHTLSNLPPQLDSLTCIANGITSITSLPSTLTYLEVSSNPDLSVLPTLPASLKVLLTAYNKTMTSLPALPSGLVYLDCGGWQALPPLGKITSLPTLPTGLKTLICQYNVLTSLPVLPDSLQILTCNNNLITSLPTLPKSLRTLACYYNKLTQIPVLPAGLTQLSCGYNQLTALPTLTNLTFLNCTGNNLTSLPALPATLGIFYCDRNQLTFLPPLPNELNVFNCAYNPLITCLPPLKKIGYSFSIDSTGIKCLPNAIQHTGAIPAIDTMPICDLLNNTNNCDINWNINGRVFNDANNDCQRQANEQKLPTVKMNLYQGTTLLQGGYFGGNYSFITGLGTYKVELDTTGLPFIVCRVDTTLSLTAIDSLKSNIDFGLRCKPAFDVGVNSIAALGFRAAGSTLLNIGAGDISNFYNAHCAAGIAGTVTVNITGPAKYISPATGALTPSSSGSNTVTWNITDFGTANFSSSFNIIVQTDITAQIGQQVCITVTVTPTAGDNNPSNNTLIQCFTVRASYDPNEKEVYPSGDIGPSQKWLTYTIHFQNTGTDTAINIYVDDTLSNNVDVSSFELLNTSHKAITQIFAANRLVKFNFPAINLPDSNINEPLSHGYAQYKVKLKDNLPIGTSIKNTAYIYFDFNAPVLTNTTTNTISVNTGISSLSIQEGLKIFPNPSTGLLNIVTTGSLIPEHIIIYDVSGKKLSEQKYIPQIDIGPLTNGIYFIELTNGTNVARGRFVKM